MEQEPTLIAPTEQTLRKVELEEDLKEKILATLLLSGFKRIHETDSIGHTLLWLKNEDKDYEVRILRYKVDRGDWEYQIDFLYDDERKTAGIVTKQAEICTSIIEGQMLIEAMIERDRK